MYVPYLRGRQYELLALRNAVDVLTSSSRILPIIEPVTTQSAALVRAIHTVTAAGGQLAVVTNPVANRRVHVGDILQSAAFPAPLRAHAGIVPALLVTSNLHPRQVDLFFRDYQGRHVCIVHRESPSDGSVLISLLSRLQQQHAAGVQVTHLVTDQTTVRYRAALPAAPIILLRDGFQRRLSNVQYPKASLFGDLHHQYATMGFHGWGDYATVGDFFSLGGGSPLAVVIHMTLLDATSDAWVQHFKSTTNLTTADLAGKFMEAARAVRTVARRHHQFRATAACQQLLDYAAAGHFPGLGKLKELSIRHHIETLAPFA